VKKSERQDKIIAVLEETAVTSISELSKRLVVSIMTIRRDLDELEQRGVLKKIHGGAVLLQKGDEPNMAQPTFQHRMDEFSEYKGKIGREAVKYIKKGDVVFFDAGTTPLAMVPHIPEDLEFTAITTGLITAVTMCNFKNINVIMIGGNTHHSSYSSINHIAIETINKLNANTAFISTKALVSPIGTFEAVLPLLEVKRAIVQASEKVILLVDHSKLGAKSLSASIAIKDIDLVITDDLAPSDMIDELRNYTQVIVVK